jgi:hypothetical protein
VIYFVVSFISFLFAKRKEILKKIFYTLPAERILGENLPAYSPQGDLQKPEISLIPELHKDRLLHYTCTICKFSENIEKSFGI